MPRVKPIPKRLLPHSTEYQAYLNNDGWKEKYADPVAIHYVRVESATSLNRSSNSEGQEANHLLIIDRVNSSSFPQVKERDRFRVLGETEYREVTKVLAPTAFGPEPHHLEIELV
ncbi:putative minor capsid protein [Sediminibacillus massiliensis]|uniref:putative minor capsid protein n=1 Tax=Sediminibacillus massiliensis TaxID=1926277 RepID=UPI0009885367|nr:putative minor capsid protein [Sediminibacillus massiliensis]